MVKFAVKHTDSQIQTHKYKYTNENIQIQIHKYKFTNINTQIRNYKYTNMPSLVSTVAHNLSVPKVSSQERRLLLTDANP